MPFLLQTVRTELEKRRRQEKQVTLLQLRRWIYKNAVPGISLNKPTREAKATPNFSLQPVIFRKQTDPFTFPKE